MSGIGNGPIASPYDAPYGTMPAVDGASVSPSDANTLTFVARALFIGVGGNVKVQMISGASLTFVSVQSGTLLPIQVCQVFNTGTTATSIVALS